MGREPLLKMQTKEIDLAEVKSQIKNIRDTVFWMDMNTHVINKEEYRKKLGRIQDFVERLEELVNEE